MPSRNATELCEQIISLSRACIGLCNSSLQICLAEATEPSYDNSFATCEKFIQDCVFVCNNMTDYCIPKDYPLNRQYNDAYSIFVLLTIVEAAAAIQVISLLLAQHEQRYRSDDRQGNALLGLGQTLGLSVGILSTVLISERFKHVPHGFTQSNPKDFDVINILIATSSIPVITASVSLGGVALDLAGPPVKKYILHAYSSCKRPAPRINAIAMFEIGDSGLEEGSSSAAPIPAAQAATLPSSSSSSSHSPSPR
jgi:hypothetical protein